jgi:hypothetical protein
MRACAYRPTCVPARNILDLPPPPFSFSPPNKHKCFRYSAPFEQERLTRAPPLTACEGERGGIRGQGAGRIEPMRACACKGRRACLGAQVCLCFRKRVEGWGKDGEKGGTWSQESRAASVIETISGTSPNAEAGPAGTAGSGWSPRALSRIPCSRFAFNKHFHTFCMPPCGSHETYCQLNCIPTTRMIPPSKPSSSSFLFSLARETG